MPTYSISAPDGNTYKIDGPPGASKDDIISHVTAKYPQAAKPKATSGPSALGIAGNVAADIAGGLANPKELGREAYHTVTDWAGHTLKAVDDLSDWLSDKTGFYQLKVGKDGVRSVSAAEYKRDTHIEDTIADALLSEKFVREPQTVTGNMVKDVGEFTLGMLTAGKAFNIANKTLQGAVSAWTVFDPQQKRLSDLVQAHPQLRNPITNYLQSDPSDTKMESRLKSAIEGTVTGKVAEGFLKGLNVLRGAMREGTAARAFEPAAEEKPRLRQVGTDAATGKPRVRLIEQGQQEAKMEMVGQAAAGKTPNLSAGIAKSSEQIAEETKGPKPVTPSQTIEQAFTPAPMAQKAQGALKEWWNWTKQLVAPGSVSPAAKQAEADIASAYAEHAQHTEELFHRSPERKEFWDTNPGKVAKFIKGFERNESFSGQAAPAAGMVRVYHGGTGQAGPQGQLWFTTSLNNAKGWAGRSPDMKLWYTDVPEKVLVEHEGFNTLAEARAQGFAPLNNVELSAKYAGQKQLFREGAAAQGEPALEKARTFYRSWMDGLAKKEKLAGIEYEAQDHYIPHLFEDQKGVQDWIHKQGVKTAGFSKDRTFDLYEQATKAGFKPRFLNPEEMFQARQHASDIALSRIDALKKLSESGLAIEGEEGRQSFRTSYATPDGKTYWVHDDAKLLLNRMFDEKSLWADKSPLGSAYRGMVTLKNNLIPVRLAFSAFHPLHVLSMHLFAASATRSLKAGEWVGSEYREGSRALKMLRGEIPNKDLSPADKQALQYIAEGGLVLEQDPRYRTSAIEKLRTSFINGQSSALAHLHTGALQTIQDLVFKTWIPSLKGASYLADVRAALKAKPGLIDNAVERRAALRELAKSVENRYGEMNYNTLFWNRHMRDVSVLSATSMGWQLGLFREYGGGAGQLANLVGKTALRPGNAKEIFNTLRKNGGLDKLTYVATYSTLAATLGGLITWSMTKSPPKGTMDFFAPRTGEQNPDGTPARVRTMFYPYEFAAMGKRVQQQGPVRAAEEWVAAKGTGIPSMLAETWTGVDGLGREIRDPNGSVMEQVKQTLNAILKENMPISLQDKGGQPESTQQKVLNIAGLSRAPKYLQETSGEAGIEDLWQKHYRPAETPYQQGVRSDLRKQLQTALQKNDGPAVDKTVEELVTKYNLRAQDVKKMVKDASQGVTSHQALFREMREEDQRTVLRKMSAEERKGYLPFAKHKVQAEFEE